MPVPSISQTLMLSVASNFSRAGPSTVTACYRLVARRILPRQVPVAQGRTQDFRRGGGVPRSAKEANKPNKRATELKPRTCAHQGQCLGPTSVCFVESSIFTALV